MRNIKIVASDLDGTFLSKGGAVTEENLRAISALTERGILFIPVTGRSFCEMPPVLAEHPGIRYFICSGGSVIYDRLTDESIITGLSAEQNDFITSVLKKRYYWPIYHYKNKVMVDRAKYELMEPALLKSGAYNDGLLGVWKKWSLDDFEGYFKGRRDIEMIASAFAGEEDQLAAVEEIRSAYPDLVISLNTFAAFNNLEVVANGADKGTALLKLVARLGIERDEVLVMGDSQNDMKMFEAFENSAAVENAAHQLRAIAKSIICKNTENSLDYVVKNLL